LIIKEIATAHMRLAMTGSVVVPGLSWFCRGDRFMTFVNMSAKTAGGERIE
jgi:hypothetical protein